MDVTTILALLQFVITEEPKVADSLQRLFSKRQPTPEDWKAERDLIAAMDFDKLVPNDKSTPPASPS
jgi:hypothetical protein